MSVAALAPQRGWTVADACAAPGNKTTQAAAYVGDSGLVLACERDSRRFEILQVSNKSSLFRMSSTCSALPALSAWPHFVSHFAHKFLREL